MDLTKRVTVALLAATALWATSVLAEDRYIVVSSTTSTENSGLFKYLLPMFRQKAGIQVRVVAQGTGQALDMGKRGDCDVVFVHDRTVELRLVKDGYFVDRHDVMYNDFVIVGPKSDPAKIAGTKDVSAALQKIVAARAPFASRGDRSGTHSAERRLWKAAGVDLAKHKGDWYRETGSGMGATLNTAAGMNAYTLTDRGTWLSFRNRQDLMIVVEGDQHLFNQYGVMLVNPAKHAHVKQTDGRAFIDWLVSAEGQQAIGAYQIGGEPLFFPNATR